MKAKTAIFLALLLVQLCAVAVAQDYVSVTELYDQVQAMGGVWRKTFETPNGEMTVEVPITMPDVEAMPVITVEKAKISEELFDTIRQGQKGGRKDEHRYETELNGKTMEFFLGRDNDYVFGEQTDNTGYDAVTALWIQHGEFRFSQGTGLMQMARPITYHDIEDVDMDKAYMRGSEMTVNDMMRLWREDIELCLGEGYVIEPMMIEVKGSNVIANPGNDVIYKRRGYTYVYALQHLEGVPIFGALAWSNGFSVPYISSSKTNRIYDQLRPYRIGVFCCDTDLTAVFVNDESYRTMSGLVKTRTVEHEDIPLAALDDVLDAVGKEIEAGRMQAIESIQLGYILYSDPEMTDCAVAVPRWTVSCEYIAGEIAEQVKRYGKQKDESEMAPTIEDENVYVYTGEMPPRSSYYWADLPIDAQSGSMILFTTGDAETFSVPKMITWEDVR